MPSKEPDFKPGDKVFANDVAKTELKRNERFRDYRVVAGPYLVKGQWHMTLKDVDSSLDYEVEVECREYHLVMRPHAPADRIINFLKGFKMKLTTPAIVTLVIGSFVLITGLWVMGNYNSLVKAKADVDNSWARVETQYQRRFDLIGNVVESVKGAQIQEQKVFGQIADARKQYQNAGTTSEKAEAAQNLETNIALIPRLQEAYPELKSNEQVSKLIGELQGTENAIAGVRDGYNNTATNYNVNIKSFPKSTFASMFNFKEQKLFKATDSAKEAPKVDLTKQN